jgi:hypothetical protein
MTFTNPFDEHGVEVSEFVSEKSVLRMVSPSLDLDPKCLVGGVQGTCCHLTVIMTAKLRVVSWGFTPRRILSPKPKAILPSVASSLRTLLSQIPTRLVCFLVGIRNPRSQHRIPP